MDNPPPYTNWVNFLAEYIIKNYGLNRFEVNNFAMSARALAHDGGWAKAPIWKGEKFDSFVQSNPDVVIIMIGNNDNCMKVNGTWTSLWNNSESVNNFINTYEELVNLMKYQP